MGLKVIFINVNSIVSRRRRHYLQLFVERHRPDVLLIAEHRLSGRHRFLLRGYTVYRQDRTGRRGGGTAVCLTERLRGERLMADLGDIEGTIVRVRGIDGGHVTVLSLYLRPQDTLRMADLDALYDAVGSGEVIIGADLNAKHTHWGGTVVNPSGRILYEWLVTNPTIVVRPTAAATRCTFTAQSFIDVFLTTVGLGLTDAIRAGDGLRTLDYDSDHMAVLLEAVTGGLERRVPKEIFAYRRMRVPDFNRLLGEELSGHGLPLDRNVTTGEIDAAVGSLTAAIDVAMNGSIPKFRPGGDFMIELPSDILQLIRQKKTLRRRMFRVHDLQEHNIIRATVRNLDNIIGQRIRIFEEEHLLRVLDGIPANADMFRKVKALSGAFNKRGIGDLVGPDGRMVVSDEDKLDIMAAEFSGMQADPAGVGDMDTSTVADNLPMVEFGRDFLADGSTVTGSPRAPLRLITRSEIGGVLKRLNNKRSSGNDGIPNFVIKRMHHRFWDHLAVLFNHCINLGYFPRSWKSSKVVPILKPGKDPTEPCSYRPISLLSSLAKLFEIFIHERMRDHIETEGVMRDFQFGFRRATSTTHALMAFADRITRGLNNRSATIAVSLDFRKAFDSVWQEGIIYKMRNFYGFDPYMVRLVRDYLVGRTLSVHLDDTLSHPRPVTAGVPQGSVLGPTLYNLFLADIPPPEGDELVVIYADDILVAATHARAKIAERRLTQYLEILRRYFVEWRLVLNVDKCACITFKGRRSRLYPNARGFIPVIRIGDSVISNCSTLKYLGVVFQEDFTFTRHVDHVLRKGRAAFHTLHWLMTRRGGLSKRVKLTIYKQLIRPTMTYAFPVWYTISSHQMERIRILERKTLSYCLDLRRRRTAQGHYISPSCRDIYDGSNTCRVDVFMTVAAIAQLSICPTHENGMVRDCSLSRGDFDRLLATEGYLPPMGLLRMSESGMLFDASGRLIFYHRRYRTYGFDDLVYRTDQ